MWYVIDTRDQIRPGTAGARVGTVVSAHRSRKAAEAADSAYQRRVKRASGNNTSYMPTRIEELTNRHKVGGIVSWSDIRG